MPGLRYYARHRRLRVVLAAFIAALSSASLWAGAMVEVPHADLALVPACTLVSFALAMVTAWSLDLQLGAMEQQRRRRFRRLRFAHLGIVSVAVALLSLRVGGALGPAWAVNFGAGLLSLCAIASLTTRLWPGVPGWLLPTAATAITFYFGIDRWTKTPRVWAWLYNPTPAGIAVSVAVSLFALGLWLRDGPPTLDPE